MADTRMQPPKAYADIASTELAKAEVAETLTARDGHQASAQTWATLAIAAAIERPSAETELRDMLGRVTEALEGATSFITMTRGMPGDPPDPDEALAAEARKLLDR